MWNNAGNGPLLYSCFVTSIFVIGAKLFSTCDFVKVPYTSFSCSLVLLVKPYQFTVHGWSLITRIAAGDDCCALLLVVMPLLLFGGVGTFFATIEFEFFNLNPKQTYRTTHAYTFSYIPTCDIIQTYT